MNPETELNFMGGFLCVIMTIAAALFWSLAFMDNSALVAILALAMTALAIFAWACLISDIRND